MILLSKEIKENDVISLKKGTHEYWLEVHSVQKRHNSELSNVNVSIYHNQNYQEHQRVIFDKKPNPLLVAPYNHAIYLTFEPVSGWKEHSWAIDLCS